MARTEAPQMMTDVLAMICGTLVLYACGVTWLKIVSGMPLGKTLALGMYPFLIGDAIKIAAAAAIARALRPVIRVPGSASRVAG
jgi:biotin transport system substrate-specific component